MISHEAIGRGLLAGEHESLALMLVMVREVRTFRAVQEKIRDWLAKPDEKGSLERFLRDRAASLGSLPTENLRLQILFEVQNVLALKPGPLNSSKDFWDACEEIASAAISLLRREDKRFRGDDLAALVKYTFDALFRQVEEAASRGSDEQRREIVKAVREHLEQLPEEQQEAIRQSLHVDKFTDEVVAKALISGGLGTAFAAAVEVAGFAAYVAAVKVLAAVAALIGITLPFGVYVTLTSVMAVLANPLFLIPAWLGGGYLLLTWSDRKIRSRLVPLVVSHLAVTGLGAMNSPSGMGDVSGCLRAHAALAGTYRTLEDNIRTGQGQLVELRSSLSSSQSRIDALDARVSELKRASDRSIRAATEAYVSDPDGLIELCESGPLTERATTLRQLFEQHAAAIAAPRGSFLKRVVSAYHSSARERAIMKAARVLIRTAARLGEARLASLRLPQSVLDGITESMKRSSDAAQVAKTRLEEAGVRDELDDRRRKCETLLRQLEGEMRQLLTAYPGMDVRASLEV